MPFKSVSSVVYFSSCPLWQLLKRCDETPRCGFRASHPGLHPFPLRISRLGCVGHVRVHTPFLPLTRSCPCRSGSSSATAALRAGVSSTPAPAPQCGSHSGSRPASCPAPSCRDRGRGCWQRGHLWEGLGTLGLYLVRDAVSLSQLVLPPQPLSRSLTLSP